MQVHANETIFVVTDDYLTKCIVKGWDSSCASCRLPFQTGHIVHTKFNGAKYKKRHIACSVRINLISRTDAKFAIAGYADMNKLPEAPPRVTA